MSITFETVCSNNNWKHVVDNFEYRLKRNVHKFDKSVLIIDDTVSVPNTIISYCNDLIRNDIITDIVDFKQYIIHIENHYGIRFNNNNRLLFINLCSILLCQTTYLLHYDSNIILSGNCNWIPLSINELEYDDSVKIITVNNNLITIEDIRLFSTYPFKIDNDFNTNCYLLRSYELKNPKLGINNNFTNSINSWLINNSFNRYVYMLGSYQFYI